MRSIDEHRREVTELLAGIAARPVAEVLPVRADIIAVHPERYSQRILAADVIAPSSLPGFDNSQMDGYAVRSADLAAATTAAPVRLAVSPRIAAGDPFGRHSPGTATPIMTGAPIPDGADAVVQIEKADPPSFHPDDTTGEALVAFGGPVEPGTFVRATGSDVTEGDVLLHAGTVLGPAHYGVVSGTGATEVEVRRRLRVLLVSTGHEIRDPGSSLDPGQIFDANSTALTVSLLTIGCDVTPAPCRSDDAADLIELLSGQVGDIDLVVTVGGVSAGAREVVRDALGPLGVSFMKVAMQPGGPQGFGLVWLEDAEGHAVERPVICLPGNPVSALVSFEAFLRPALLATSGAGTTSRELRRGRAAESFDSPPNHHQLRRGVVDDEGRLELVGSASSHLLHSYAGSTVLVHVPVGTASVTAGDELDFWRIDG